MNWTEQLKGDTLSWLLEPDQPGVRYLAMRDLQEKKETDPEFKAARQEAHTTGLIAMVLDKMQPEGY
jgi:hypothetical protein